MYNEQYTHTYILVIITFNIILGSVIPKASARSGYSYDYWISDCVKICLGLFTYYIGFTDIGLAELHQEEKDCHFKLLVQ